MNVITNDNELYVKKPEAFLSTISLLDNNAEQVIETESISDSEKIEILKSEVPLSKRMITKISDSYLDIVNFVGMRKAKKILN